MDELPPHMWHDAASPSPDRPIVRQYSQNRTALSDYDRVAAAQRDVDGYRDNFLWGSETESVYFDEAIQPTNEHPVIATLARSYNYTPQYNNAPVPRYANGLVSQYDHGLLSQNGMGFSNNAATGCSLLGESLSSSSATTWTPGMANMGAGPSVQVPMIPEGYGSSNNWLHVPKASTQPWHNRFVAAHHQYRVGDTVDMPIVVDETETENGAEEEEETEDSDSDAEIGIALKNGRYKCNVPRCSRKTFNRPAELRRHYHTVHVVRRQFWCTVPSCKRSLAAGDRPFPRVDKLRDHVLKMHRDT